MYKILILLLTWLPFISKGMEQEDILDNALTEETSGLRAEYNQMHNYFDNYYAAYLEAKTAKDAKIAQAADVKRSYIKGDILAKLKNGFDLNYWLSEVDWALPHILTNSDLTLLQLLLVQGINKQNIERGLTAIDSEIASARLEAGFNPKDSKAQIRLKELEDNKRALETVSKN
jgi:hypothetical protein